MTAIELISKDIPTLRTSDTGQAALDLMDTFRVSHLPVVNNIYFLGLISDNDIYSLNKLDEPIGNHKLSLYSPFIFSDQHFYELISLMTKLKLSVIPVLQRDKKYIGAIRLSNLIYQFAEFSGVGQAGGVIILELNQNDYSLTEISQIVEGNDAKILNLYVNTKTDSTKLDLTIKLNLNDLTSVLQTFERYGYTIKNTFSEEGKFDSLLEDRYNEFMRYLNM